MSVDAETEVRASGAQPVAIDPSTASARPVSACREENALEVAAAQAPVMIWMCGPDGVVYWCNPACAAFTDLDCEALHGEGWLDQIHPEDRERYRGIVSTSLQARQPFRLDYRLRHHRRGYRWVMDHGVPRSASGEIAGYIGSVVDIHHRKELEEQLAERTRALRHAERRQGAFLDMLSHELRNPLAPIANASSVLRTLEHQNPVLPRLREILDRQVERLGQMVKDLIDATRSAQGHISLINAPVAIETIVNGGVESTRKQLDRAGHGLEVNISAAGLLVRGDAARLSQALASLLSNACKFTDGPDVINLSVEKREGHVQFIVSDPGRGMSPDFVRHAFELFAQEDADSGRKPEGLGVGLTLARRIVQLHGGRLEAHSEGRGHGSRFILSLPVMADPDRPGPPHDIPSLCDSYRVLVIEGAQGRDSLQAQMLSWGNEVRAVANAEDAVSMAQELRPHIVLCDLGTTGLDGFGLLAALRTSVPDPHAIVAAVAGTGCDDDEDQALSAGYDSFLVKPVQPGSLVRLLRSYSSSATRLSARELPATV